MHTNQDWDARYVRGETGWNLHQPSPPLLYLLDQLPTEAKSWPILFPGAGESPDPAVWYARGFHGVHVVDVSPTAKANFLNKHPYFPENQYLIQDFFTLDKPEWRLIIEQTFYCAILPERRREYAATMRNLLADGGELQGVWFNRTFPHAGPPFGGDIESYIEEIQPFLTLMEASPCSCSAAPRAGTEIIMRWKKEGGKIQTTEGHQPVP
jgi:thiopurine S-methyltransferase